VRIAGHRFLGQSALLKLVNASSRKPLILVDDDVSYTSLLTQLMVEHLDCPVVAFSRPRDALAALPKLGAGVIITDYEMPGMNGFEFIAETTKLLPQVPCILITGHPLDVSMQQRIAASAVKVVLSKPFGWSKLSDEIVHWWPEAGSMLRATSPSA